LQGQFRALSQSRLLNTETLNHSRQLRQILGEEGMANSVKYRVDLMEFESLNPIEPKPEEESKEPERPSSTNQQLNAEESILSYDCATRFRTWEDIA
jgi:hypothetical protein